VQYIFVAPTSLSHSISENLDQVLGKLGNIVFYILVYFVLFNAEKMIGFLE